MHTITYNVYSMLIFQHPKKNYTLLDSTYSSIQKVYYSLQQKKVKRVKGCHTVPELVVVWSAVVLIQV